MISLQYNQIPVFLHRSAFYQSLDEESSDGEGEVIQIPERCFKENDEVNNIDDFGQLLHTMQFWGVDVIPDSMIEFLHATILSDWEPVAKDTLDWKSKLLEDLTEIYGAFKFVDHRKYICVERVKIVITRNRNELLSYWIGKGWYKEENEYIYRYMSSIEFAAERGSTECLQILVINNFKMTCTTAAIAAQNGHLHCLRFLRNSNCPWDKDVLVAAARGGYLDILEYAHEHGLEWDWEACTVAASYGHLHCLRFAREHGCPWTSDVTRSAAYYGTYDCLRYALEHGCGVTILIGAAYCAAASGHLDCLQLLHQFDAPWDSSATCVAAEYGHLHILKFLHEHYCPWDIHMLIAATKNGFLDCIKYAHEQGLKISKVDWDYLCNDAEMKKQFAVLDYFRENQDWMY